MLVFSFSYWKCSCTLSIFSVVFAHAHVVLLTTQKSRRAEKKFHNARSLSMGYWPSERSRWLDIGQYPQAWSIKWALYIGLFSMARKEASYMQKSMARSPLSQLDECRNTIIWLVYIFDEKMSNAYVWMEWQMYETARVKFEAVRGYTWKFDTV